MRIHSQLTGTLLFTDAEKKQSFTLHKQHALVSQGVYRKVHLTSHICVIFKPRRKVVGMPVGICV